MDEKGKRPLIIKRRGEDGNRVITVRLRESLLAELDAMVADTNRSRNELINIIIEYGLKNAVTGEWNENDKEI